MKSKKVDLKRISDALTERCPFIMFAMLTGIDQEGRQKWFGNLELSVFVGSDIGTWYALEKILPVITSTVPEFFWNVTLLNRADAFTRYRAVQGLCLFIREGREQQFQQFTKHAHLDYRILRAHLRKRGFIEND